MGANVSVVKHGIAHMEIDSRKCNDCGKCINVCVHNARDYLDDIDVFYKDLQNGEKISLIIDPSFYYTFGDRADKITGYLKTLGILR